MPRVLLASLVALAVSGCGGAVGAPGPSPSLPPSPSASPSPTPTGHVVMVTRADDKGTVTARVGDRIQIALGEQYDWRLDPPDGIVLVRQTPQTYLLVRGTQAIWLARSAGTSTIHATGTVPCPSGKACIQIVVSFSATVDVQP